MENDFVYSNYSINDLEEFRDSDGFIDLDKAGIKFTEGSREIIGNPNRLKNWVNFNGTKVLIKGEALLEDEQNYGIYGELITEEISKKLGIETAHYDLIKITGEEGKTIFGVLSESIVDLENGERLDSLHDIIGDEPEKDYKFLDTTDYQFTIDKLREKLLLDGIDEKQIEQVIQDYKKRLAFGISILDTDKHTENIAFIRKKKNGKETIRLSPNFDSESALMLDTNLSTVKRLLADYQALQESTSFADPRIGTLVSKEDGGFGSLWMDTLDLLCEDDEIFNYYSDVLEKPIDMDEIFVEIESRIGTSLPEDVKLLAKYSYKCRNEEMQKVIEGEILEETECGVVDIALLLKNLTNQGITAGIRTGEQITIGKNMEKDISEKVDNKEKNIQMEKKTNSDDTGNRFSVSPDDSVDGR